MWREYCKTAPNHRSLTLTQIQINRATQPFLNFDTATRAFLQFDMRHGHLRDMRQGYFLNLTGDMGLKIVSDMRQGYF